MMFHARDIRKQRDATRLVSLVPANARIRARRENEIASRTHRPEYSPRRTARSPKVLCASTNTLYCRRRRGPVRKPVSGLSLSKSSTRDLRSVKRRPSAAVQLPCNIVLPPCTLPTNWSSPGLWSVSNNDIGIDFPADAADKADQLSSLAGELGAKVLRDRRIPASGRASTCSRAESSRMNKGDATFYPFSIHLIPRA